MESADGVSGRFIISKKAPTGAFSYYPTASPSQAGWGLASGCATAQLLFVHDTGRLRQQALGALVLGPRRILRDGLGTGHQGDDAVQPEGKATMGWCAVLQRIEQEAKLELGFRPIFSASNTLLWTSAR